MAHFHDNALIGASGQGGYQIERSLRFNSADSAYLNRTPASAGSSRKFTLSAWVKITSDGSGYKQITFLGAGTGSQTNTGNDNIQLRGNGTGLQLGVLANGGFGGTYAQFTAYHRDPSSWQHVVIAIDTTQATQANRCRAYFNGVEETTYVANGFGLNFDFPSLNSTAAHVIGRCNEGGGPNHTDALLTEYHFIDGQALTPSSFGETDTITGVWKPKKVVGMTYGTNGFYLKFADNSGTTSTTLGKDSSGNGNNWTPNNFSVTAGAGNDSLIDTPTPYADGGNGRGNYATLNPVDTGGPSPSNGNLDISWASASWRTIRATQGITTGKWYWEFTVTSTVDSNNTHGIGIATSNAGISNYLGADANGWAYTTHSGNKTNNGTNTVYGNTIANTDVVGVAFDATNGKLFFAKNNTWQASGDPVAGTNAAFTGLTSGPYLPAIGLYGNSTASGNFNFGQRAFAYTPPSGFLALNTQNLPEPTIKKPSSYMGVSLWTGTGSNQTISGLGFQPDLIWAKNRNLGNDHVLFDAVRGFNSNKPLYSNQTWSEGQYQYADIKSVNSDGYVVGAGASGDNYINYNTYTYVGWSWKESATPGFDIVTYTGNGTARTIAHSLGVAPSMMVIKRRDAADDWGVYHTSLGNTQYLYLDSTQAAATSANFWNNTSPTSSVFSVAGSTVVNANTGTYVAYLWSEVAGFSKFGSYSGTGSSDGPFVFCGFKPRWLMIKRSDSTESWLIFDTARETYNPTDDVLWANLSNAESANYTPQDFTSNGFKIRTSSTSTNASGGTYIYAAFAETPFRYSLAR